MYFFLKMIGMNIVFDNKYLLDVKIVISID